MTELDMITAVAQVGFPIAVASYVLLRLETTIKENTATIQAMMLMLKKVCDKLNHSNTQ